MSTVLDLDRRRIERALSRRGRYKYVHPRLLSATEGAGWVIVSPNCSRNVDAAGGEIPIAWLEPGESGWTLHRRCHAEGRWVAHAAAAHLPALLDPLVRDEARLFWV